MQTEKIRSGIIYAIAVEILLYIAYSLRISFVWQYPDAIFLALIWIPVLNILAKCYCRSWKSIMGYVLLLLTCWAFYFLLVALNVPTIISTICIIAIAGGIYALFAKVSNAWVAAFLGLSIVHSYLFIGSILYLVHSQSIFSYAYQDPYRECLGGKCVSVYYMQTGFFFGDDHYRATKNFHISFLEQEIDLGKLPRHQMFMFRLKEWAKTNLEVNNKNGEMIRSVEMD